MADPIVLTAAAGIFVVIGLLVWILVAVHRRSAAAALDPNTISAHVAQSMQPVLLDMGQRLAALQMLGPLKESADQKLPSIQKSTDDLGVLIAATHKARLDEEKLVRESLVRLAELTKHTPELAKQVAVLQSELKRLQSVETGVRELTNLFLSTQGRGLMGEEAVRTVFQSFPQETWKEQYAIGSGRVDFAVFMPNGRVLPIDSKTSGLQSIADYYALGQKVAAATEEGEREAALREQGKLQTKVRGAVLNKASEVAEYIQPEKRTLGIAIQAVPDSLFPILDIKTRKLAAEQNVQIVPYGLLLPVVNILRGQNQYDKLDFQAVVDAMHGIRLQANTVRDVLVNKFEKAEKFIHSGIADVQGALKAIDGNADSIEDGDRGPERKARTRLKQAGLVPHD